MGRKFLSILREEEYKLLSFSKLHGKVLDLGGSKKSGYHELLGNCNEITTVNIDPDYVCDLVFDIEKRFPIQDEEFDHVLCINVLEHIYNYNNVISESFRVLKNEGSLVLITPFMHHLHYSDTCGDYFRYTKFALERIIHDNGFGEIEIRELGGGIFSLVFQTTFGAIPTYFLKNSVKRCFVLLDNLMFRISPRYGKLKKVVPLGYMITAKKISNGRGRD